MIFSRKAILITAITAGSFSLISCGDSSADNIMESSDSTATEMADNSLTDAQKAEGWQLLFDGKSLDGWHIYQNREANSWVVDSGEIHCLGSGTDKSDKRADLISDSSFTNFELSMDYKISPQGNSGIVYLCSEEADGAWMTGPEYQIIDDENFPEKLAAWQKTAANYAMDTAVGANPNPPGEWNNARIVVNNGHVEHWLNDKKVVEYEWGSDEWKKNKAEGKWKDHPEYGTATTGHIDLQDHGSEAWFRNIMIRKL